ncbi:MAG TPA: GxxExxY protein [Rhabdochlamydiaceae bacterium]|nr:GxxExxY protein [Rhabdochlamydiaceae bacterium]
MQDDLPHFNLTRNILKCCFDVMNTLGSGFLESVYKNALIISMAEQGLKVDTEKRFEVVFRNRKVGMFIPDLIVEDDVIVELKCCQYLLPEHQAQLINYLKVSDIEIGLLINFGRRRLEYKRVYHPAYPAARDPAYPVFLKY